MSIRCVVLFITNSFHILRGTKVEPRPNYCVLRIPTKCSGNTWLRLLKCSSVVCTLDMLHRVKREELASVPCEPIGNVFSAPSLDDLLSGRSIWSKWPKMQQLNLGLRQSGEVARDTGSSREWVHGCQASVMERFPSEDPKHGRFSLSRYAHIYIGEENVSVRFLDKKGHKRFVSVSRKEQALPKMLPLCRDVTARFSGMLYWESLYFSFILSLVKVSERLLFLYTTYNILHEPWKNLAPLRPVLFTKPRWN